MVLPLWHDTQIGLSRPLIDIDSVNSSILPGSGSRRRPTTSIRGISTLEICL
jgi:hypothetical protein